MYTEGKETLMYGRNKSKWHYCSIEHLKASKESDTYFMLSSR